MENGELKRLKKYRKYANVKLLNSGIHDNDKQTFETFDGIVKPVKSLDLDLNYFNLNIPSSNHLVCFKSTIGETYKNHDDTIIFDVNNDKLYYLQVRIIMLVKI